MNIKPGDLFEWVYTCTHLPMKVGEEIYTFSMKKWVPGDGLCLCISIKDNMVYWVCRDGLFHCRTFPWGELDAAIRPAGRTRAGRPRARVVKHEH